MTAFALTCSLGNAFAEDSGKPAAPGASSPGQPQAAVVAWDEFRERCAQPEKFDVQRAPQNIRVQCTDQRLTWMAAPPTALTLPCDRTVGGAVFSDKFYVANSERAFEISAKAGSCHRFQEVEERISIERPVSCDEILGVKGDVHEWCASVLDGVRMTNPKLVERNETNRVFDTCADAKIHVIGNRH
jgi:hypothetical protein